MPLSQSTLSILKPSSDSGLLKSSTPSRKLSSETLALLVPKKSSGLSFPNILDTASKIPAIAGTKANQFFQAVDDPNLMGPLAGYGSIIGVGEGLGKMILGFIAKGLWGAANLLASTEIGTLKGDKLNFDPTINIEKFNTLQNKLNEIVDPLVTAHSRSGKGIHEFIGSIATAVGNYGEASADVNLESTSSPEWAAAVRIFPEMLFLALPMKAKLPASITSPQPKTTKLDLALEKARKTTLPTNAISKLLDQPRGFDAIPKIEKGGPLEISEFNYESFIAINKRAEPTWSDAAHEATWLDYSTKEFLRAYQNPLLRMDDTHPGFKFENGVAKFTKEGVDFRIADHEFTLTPNEFNMEFLKLLMNKPEVGGASATFSPITKKMFGSKGRLQTFKFGDKIIDTEGLYKDYVKSRMPENTPVAFKTTSDVVEQAFNVRQIELANRIEKETNLAYKQKYLSEVENKVLSPGENKQVQTDRMWDQRAFDQARAKEQDYRAMESTRPPVKWDRSPGVMDYLNKKEEGKRIDVVDDMLDERLNDIMQSANQSLNEIAPPPIGRVGGRFNPYERGAVSPDLLFTPFIAARRTFKTLADFNKEVLQNKFEANSPILKVLYSDYNKALLQKGGAIINPALKPMQYAMGSTFLTPKEVKDVDKVFSARIDFSKSSMPVLAGITEIMSGQSISRIRELQEFSPTMRKIADELFRPESGMGITTATEGRSFVQNRQLKLAEFYNRYTEIVKDIPVSIRDKVLNPALRGIQNPLAHKYQTQIGQLRQLLDDDYKYEAEVFGDQIKPYENNYNTRYYVLGNSKKQAGFEALLTKYGANEVSRNETIANITTGKGSIAFKSPFTMKLGLNPQTYRLSKKGPIDFERVLKKIPEEELMPYLEQSLDTIMRRRLDESTMRTEMARKFGPNGKILDKMIEQASKELQENGKTLEAWRARSIYDIVNALQRTYMLEATHPAWTKTQRAIQTAGNIALLQLVTARSIPEIWLPMSKVGVYKFAKTMTMDNVPGIMRTLLKTSGVKVNRTLAEQITKDIGKAADATSMEIINQMWHGDMSKIDAGWFKLNGLHYWTKMCNYAAVNAYTRMWQDYLKRVANNKNTDSLENLRMVKEAEYMGWNHFKAVEWAKSGFNIDHPFYNKFKASALTFAEDFVLTPNAANTPLWFSNPNLSFLSYLKKFPYLMGTQVWKKWGNESWATTREMLQSPTPLNARNAAGTMTNILATITGMLLTSHFINEWIDTKNYGPKNIRYKTTPEKGIRAADRAGMWASLYWISDFYEFGYRGLWGIFSPLATKTDDIMRGVWQTLPDPGKKTSTQLLAREITRFVPGSASKPLHEEYARIAQEKLFQDKYKKRGEKEPKIKAREY